MNSEWTMILDGDFNDVETLRHHVIEIIEDLVERFSLQASIVLDSTKQW